MAQTPTPTTRQWRSSPYYALLGEGREGTASVVGKTARPATAGATAGGVGGLRNLNNLSDTTSSAGGVTTAAPLKRIGRATGGPWGQQRAPFSASNNSNWVGVPTTDGMNVADDNHYAHLSGLGNAEGEEGPLAKRADDDIFNDYKYSVSPMGTVNAASRGEGGGGGGGAAGWSCGRRPSLTMDTPDADGPMAQNGSTKPLVPADVDASGASYRSGGYGGSSSTPTSSAINAPPATAEARYQAAIWTPQLTVAASSYTQLQRSRVEEIAAWTPATVAAQLNNSKSFVGLSMLVDAKSVQAYLNYCEEMDLHRDTEAARHAAEVEKILRAAAHRARQPSVLSSRVAGRTVSLNTSNETAAGGGGGGVGGGGKDISATAALNASNSSSNAAATIVLPHEFELSTLGVLQRDLATIRHAQATTKSMHAMGEGEVIERRKQEQQEKDRIAARGVPTEVITLRAGPPIVVKVQVMHGSSHITSPMMMSSGGGAGMASVGQTAAGGLRNSSADATAPPSAVASLNQNYNTAVSGGIGGGGAFGFNTSHGGSIGMQQLVIEEERTMHRLPFGEALFLNNVDGSRLLTLTEQDLVGHFGLTATVARVALKGIAELKQPPVVDQHPMPTTLKELLEEQKWELHWASNSAVKEAAFSMHSTSSTAGGGGVGGGGPSSPSSPRRRRGSMFSDTTSDGGLRSTDVSRPTSALEQRPPLPNTAASVSASSARSPLNNRRKSSSVAVGADDGLVDDDKGNRSSVILNGSQQQQLLSSSARSDVATGVDFTNNAFKKWSGLSRSGQIRKLTEQRAEAMRLKQIEEDNIAKLTEVDPSHLSPIELITLAGNNGGDDAHYSKEENLIGFHPHSDQLRLANHVSSTVEDQTRQIGILERERRHTLLKKLYTTVKGYLALCRSLGLDPEEHDSDDEEDGDGNHEGGIGNNGGEVQQGSPLTPAGGYSSSSANQTPTVDGVGLPTASPSARASTTSIPSPFQQQQQQVAVRKVSFVKGDGTSTPVNNRPQSSRGVRAAPTVSVQQRPHSASAQRLPRVSFGGGESGGGASDGTHTPGSAGGGPLSPAEDGLVYDTPLNGIATTSNNAISGGGGALEGTSSSTSAGQPPPLPTHAAISTVPPLPTSMVGKSSPSSPLTSGASRRHSASGNAVTNTIVSKPLTVRWVVMRCVLPIVKLTTRTSGRLIHHLCRSLQREYVLLERAEALLALEASVREPLEQMRQMATDPVNYDNERYVTLSVAVERANKAYRETIRALQGGDRDGPTAAELMAETRGSIASAADGGRHSSSVNTPKVPALSVAALQGKRGAEGSPLSITAASDPYSSSASPLMGSPTSATTTSNIKPPTNSRLLSSPLYRPSSASSRSRRALAIDLIHAHHATKREAAIKAHPDVLAPLLAQQSPISTGFRSAFGGRVGMRGGSFCLSRRASLFDVQQNGGGDGANGAGGSGVPLQTPFSSRPSSPSYQRPSEQTLARDAERAMLERRLGSGEYSFEDDFVLNSEAFTYAFLEATVHVSNKEFDFILEHVSDRYGSAKVEQLRRRKLIAEIFEDACDAWGTFEEDAATQNENANNNSSAAYQQDVSSFRDANLFTPPPAAWCMPTSPPSGALCTPTSARQTPPATFTDVPASQGPTATAAGVGGCSPPPALTNKGCASSGGDMVVTPLSTPLPLQHSTTSHTARKEKTLSRLALAQLVNAYLQLEYRSTSASKNRMKDLGAVSAAHSTTNATSKLNNRTVFMAQDENDDCFLFTLDLTTRNRLLKQQQQQLGHRNSSQQADGPIGRSGTLMINERSTSLHARTRATGRGGTSGGGMGLLSPGSSTRFGAVGGGVGCGGGFNRWGGSSAAPSARATPAQQPLLLSGRGSSTPAGPSFTSGGNPPTRGGGGLTVGQVAALQGSLGGGYPNYQSYEWGGGSDGTVIAPLPAASDPPLGPSMATPPPASGLALMGGVNDTATTPQRPLSRAGSVASLTSGGSRGGGGQTPTNGGLASVPGIRLRPSAVGLSSPFGSSGKVSPGRAVGNNGSRTASPATAPRNEGVNGKGASPRRHASPSSPTTTSPTTSISKRGKKVFAMPHRIDVKTFVKFVAGEWITSPAEAFDKRMLLLKTCVMSRRMEAAKLKKLREIESKYGVALLTGSAPSTTGLHLPAAVGGYRGGGGALIAGGSIPIASSEGALSRDHSISEWNGVPPVHGSESSGHTTPVADGGLSSKTMGSARFASGGVGTSGMVSVPDIGGLKRAHDGVDDDSLDNGIIGGGGGVVTALAVDGSLIEDDPLAATAVGAHKDGVLSSLPSDMTATTTPTNANTTPNTDGLRGGGGALVYRTATRLPPNADPAKPQQQLSQDDSTIAPSGHTNKKGTRLLTPRNNHSTTTAGVPYCTSSAAVDSGTAANAPAGGGDTNAAAPSGLGARLRSSAQSTVAPSAVEVGGLPVTVTEADLLHPKPILGVSDAFGSSSSTTKAAANGSNSVMAPSTVVPPTSSTDAAANSSGGLVVPPKPVAASAAPAAPINIPPPNHPLHHESPVPSPSAAAASSMTAPRSFAQHQQHVRELILKELEASFMTQEGFEALCASTVTDASQRPIVLLLGPDKRHRQRYLDDLSEQHRQELSSYGGIGAAQLSGAILPPPSPDSSNPDDGRFVAYPAVLVEQYFWDTKNQFLRRTEPNRFLNHSAPPSKQQQLCLYSVGTTRMLKKLLHSMTDKGGMNRGLWYYVEFSHEGLNRHHLLGEEVTRRLAEWPPAEGHDFAGDTSVICPSPLLLQQQRGVGYGFGDPDDDDDCTLRGRTSRVSSAGAHRPTGSALGRIGGSGDSRLPPEEDDDFVRDDDGGESFFGDEYPSAPPTGRVDHRRPHNHRQYGGASPTSPLTIRSNYGGKSAGSRSGSPLLLRSARSGGAVSSAAASTTASAPVRGQRGFIGNNPPAEECGGLLESFLRQLSCVIMQQHKGAIHPSFRVFVRYPSEAVNKCNMPTIAHRTTHVIDMVNNKALTGDALLGL